ncbi:transcriptional regulator [Vibrio splendidus]|uniref:LysR family transcriptional regulator n=1 Tax=Vibrio splendidus TaxID=29497 RepID=UPI000C827146|nr:LysR family transcriptional regulator [Vibrio splendidus]MCC5518470.1 LysR family transcriptional regulator [Vibrio splendidus]MDH5894508.1 LysR family transcriptional regulator [Vibrio splendidus]PTP90849.1 transcriptional regulator [Vibrio splendidus]
MSKLKQMSIFAHIVEQGSVSAAAEKLELSKSVVSQHLKILEQELGASLLKRTTRRQSLTSMGERFYLSCKDINVIAESAWDMAKAELEEPQGRIRITASNALMDLLVVPVIADLMKQYPKLKPELISDDQHLDFMEHDIDLAVRVGTSRDSNLKQKRLGEFKDVLCGVESMLFRELKSIPYIANSWQGKQVTHHFSSQNEQDFIYQQPASCITNSFHSCLALIKSGVGIGAIPDFYLHQLSGEVVDMMPSFQLPTNTVYALNPFASNTPIAIKLCIQALEEKLKCNLV